MNEFGKLAPVLAWFGRISFLVGSFTQSVGIPLGAVLTVWFITSVTAEAIRNRYRWRRSAFIFFFPVVLWLLTHADLGALWPFIFLAGLVIYLYGLGRFVSAGRAATPLSSPDGPGTASALFRCRDHDRRNVSVWFVVDESVVVGRSIAAERSPGSCGSILVSRRFGGPGSDRSWSVVETSVARGRWLGDSAYRLGSCNSRDVLLSY